MTQRKRIRLVPLQSERAPLFGCVPTDICLYPQCHDLRPFALAAFATINSIARLVHDDELHEAALEGGREAIEQERGFAEAFKNDWTDFKSARRTGSVPERYHVAQPTKLRIKPMKLQKAIKLAGKAGYNSTKERLRKQRLPTVSFITSRALLLRAMRIAPATRNRRSLDDALSTLSKPIRVGNWMHDPFLSIEKKSAGRFIVRVSENWLRRDWSYQTIPLPLPTKSPLATHMVLWLRAVKPKSATQENSDISFRKLCELFKIEETPWVARLAVNNALDFINCAYLPKLDHKALLKFNIKMPSIYEIKPIANGDRISFFSHQAGTFKYDRLIAAQKALRSERLNNRRKPSRKRVRVRIDVVRPEPTPTDVKEFKKFLVEKGYPTEFDMGEMNPTDRRELQALIREFESNAV